jgi:hypothetical protein
MRYERFLLKERPKYIPMKPEDVARSPLKMGKRMRTP